MFNGRTVFAVASGPVRMSLHSGVSGAGLSTMVVFHHFGRRPDLIRAVVDQGYRELDRAFSRLPVTDDPVADLFVMALTTRRIACAIPHPYDLMFGLSTRATCRPASEVRLSGRSPAFRTAYAHLLDACNRSASSGRVEPAPLDVIAAALLSFVHGYITLELADHFVEFDDPVQQVLLHMGVTFAVGLGDTRERAQASHEAGARHYDTTTRDG